MTKRILLTAMLGGIALFVWGALSHTVLGLGEHGVQYLAQSQPLMDVMKGSVPQAGIYYLPLESAGKMRPEQENGPWGVLIYQPSGATLGMTRNLVSEAILNILQALIIGILLSLVPGMSGYFSRVGFVVLVAILAATGLSVQYWNWYGFPTSYTLATIADKLIGYTIVGLIAAAFIKPASGRIQAVPAKAA